jgi:hypothetical protein
MRIPTIGLILSGLLLAPAARADFVVAGQKPAAAPDTPAAHVAPRRQ